MSVSPMYLQNLPRNEALKEQDEDDINLNGKQQQQTSSASQNYEKKKDLFSFKQYMKKKIDLENRLGCQEDQKKEEKKNEISHYVQHLINLKQQFEKNNFLYQYKQKYFKTQEQYAENIFQNDNQKDTGNSSFSSQSYQMIKKQNNNQINISSNQQSFNNLTSNQKNNDLLRNQTNTNIKKNNDNNNTNIIQLNKDTSNYRQSRSSLSKSYQSNIIQDGIQILKQFNDDKSFYSSKIINTKNQISEIQFHSHNNNSNTNNNNHSEPKKQINVVKKQSSQKILKKNYESFIRQTSYENQEGMSSGDEFDLDILPKSKQIYSSKGNNIIPTTNSFNNDFLKAHSKTTRQSLDFNYLSQQKNQQDEELKKYFQETKKLSSVNFIDQQQQQQQFSSTSQSQQNQQNENIKQIITTKRKFASENLQKQQIKILKKLIPQAYVKVQTNKDKQKINSNLKQEKEKVKSSEMSINNIRISSEETDIETTDVTSRAKSSNHHRSSSTSLKCLIKPSPSIIQQLEQPSLTKIKINKNSFKSLKHIPQRSKSAQKYSSENNLLKKSRHQQTQQVEKQQQSQQSQYPMINVLICDNNSIENAQKCNIIKITHQKQCNLSFTNLNQSNKITQLNSDRTTPLNNIDQSQEINKQIDISNNNDKINLKNTNDQQECQKIQIHQFIKDNCITKIEDGQIKKQKRYHLKLNKNQKNKISSQIQQNLYSKSQQLQSSSQQQQQISNETSSNQKISINLNICGSKIKEIKIKNSFPSQQYLETHI